MSLQLCVGNHRALSQIAEPVPEGEDVSALIDEMWAVMRAGRGIGLAANQVGVLKRVIVLGVNGLNQEFINPVITLRHGGQTNSKEGCLSFPGRRALMVRSRRVTLHGFTRDWKPIRRELRDLAAYCAQHEVDHLNGKTIAMSNPGASA